MNVSRNNSFFKKRSNQLFIVQFIIFALLCITINVYWLFVVIASYGMAALIIFYFISLSKTSQFRQILKILFILIFVAAFGIGIKSLAFEIFRVPSNSMEAVLYPEDVILVNKLIYGPYLSYNFFHQNFNDRLKGTGDVCMGDVFVFRLSESFIVKRCVAIPGDTLTISNGDIFINNLKYNSPITVKNNYKISYKSCGDANNRSEIELEKSTKKKHIDKTRFFNKTLSVEEYNKIRNSTKVEKIERLLDSFDINKDLFAIPKDSLWTIDNMGPFVIPRKGLRIVFNKYNFEIYKSIINSYEKNKISEKNGVYYLNGVVRKDYIFNQDYYFMLGDNRKESLDSRFYGFIPRSAIEGKVQYVLFSKYRNKFRRKRFFKQVI